MIHLQYLPTGRFCFVLRAISNNCLICIFYFTIHVVWRLKRISAHWSKTRQSIAEILNIGCTTISSFCSVHARFWLNCGKWTSIIVCCIAHRNNLCYIAQVQNPTCHQLNDKKRKCLQHCKSVFNQFAVPFEGVTNFLRNIFHDLVFFINAVHCQLRFVIKKTFTRLEVTCRYVSLRRAIIPVVATIIHTQSDINSY